MYCSWFNLQRRLSTNNVFTEKVCLSCAANFNQSKSANLITVRYPFHANEIMFCFFLVLLPFFLNDWNRPLWQAAFPIPVAKKVFILTYGEKKKSLISLNQKVIFSIECTTTHWLGNGPWPCAFTHCCLPRVSCPTMQQKRQIPHLAECETRCRSSNVQGTWESSLRKRLRISAKQSKVQKK